MNIQDLISQNKIEAAISLLEDQDFKIMTLSRFNRLKKQEMMGTLDYREIATERSRIVSAILNSHCSNADGLYVTPVATVNPVASMSSLDQLYKKHRRRNPDFGKKVLALIEKVKSYEVSKSTVAGFDTSNRRLNALKEEAASLVQESNNMELDSLENKTKKILSLVSANVPTYKSLSEAWAICQGLGMTNSWIPQALENKASDDEVKINIAEAIEDFVSDN